MRVYETMGDTLALQYGGFAAHNKLSIWKNDDRRDQWKAATESQEFFRTLQRYCSNAYMDAEKQDAINPLQSAHVQRCLSCDRQLRILLFFTAVGVPFQLILVMPSYCCWVSFSSIIMLSSSSCCSYLLLNPIVVQVRGALVIICRLECLAQNGEFDFVLLSRASNLHLVEELYVPGLRDHVKSQYPLGPVWSATGKTIVPAPSKAPTTTAPAPPPPPPASLSSSESPQSSSSRPKEEMSAVCQEINSGKPATAGLRKVTDDMKTKNHTDRTDIVSASEKKSHGNSM
ncbi:hypothetical protein U1Q18_011005 [Sarracenia purpurea var. burkii]